GRTTLVHREDVRIRREVVQRPPKPVVRVRSGVRAVGLRRGGLLRRRHRPRARVGQQVDRDHVRGQVECVVRRAGERFLTLLAGRDRYFLDDLDPIRGERFHGSFFHTSRGRLSDGSRSPFRSRAAWAGLRTLPTTGRSWCRYRTGPVAVRRGPTARGPRATDGL